MFIPFHDKDCVVPYHQGLVNKFSCMAPPTSLIVLQPLYFKMTPLIKVHPSCAQPQESIDIVAMNNSPWVIPPPSGFTFELSNRDDIAPVANLDPLVTLCPLGIQAPMIATGISFVEEKQPESKKPGRYVKTKPCKR